MWASKGSGVKVAIWENANATSPRNLSITARYKSSGLRRPSDHARHTHGIVKNIEAQKPRGHAPSSSLHSANTKDLDALPLGRPGQGLHGDRPSFPRPAPADRMGSSFDDIYKDWLILQRPYPTICQAAGNYWDATQRPPTEYVNHKGYNSLGVANHNDTAAGDVRRLRVPQPASSSHGDRELPEIAANGTGVTTVGLTMSGTSIASPAAAGCDGAASRSVDGTLKSWPEGGRASCSPARSATSPAERGGRTSSARRRHDGSGAVDALEAVNIRQAAPLTQCGGDRARLGRRHASARATSAPNERTTFLYSVKRPVLFPRATSRSRSRGTAGSRCSPLGDRPCRSHRR